jgi:hypothetical protein
MSIYPILTDSSYKTVPALSILHTLTPTQLKQIDFSISNKHGEIKFLSKVDLSNINLDETIKISKSFAEVYPGPSPAIGAGLNVPAIITLNHLSQDPKPIKLQCKSMSCDFLSHNPESGQTSFKVSHFTRYAFQVESSSSSSEEEDPQEDKPKKFDSPQEGGADLHLNLEESSNLSKFPIEETVSHIDIEKVKERQKEDDPRLNFSKPFKFGVSPQGLIYLPGVQNNLRGFKISFENEQACKGLDVQMSAILNSSSSSLASVTHLENIWYVLAQVYLQDSTFDEVSNESQIWTLFNVLFGSPWVDVNDLSSREVPKKEQVLNQAQVQVLRKKAFLNWVKKWKQGNLGLDTGMNLINKLANGEIGPAAAEAAKNGFAHLAVLISLTSTEYTRTEIASQIEVWTRARIFDTFSKSIAVVYQILSGSLAYIPDNLNWKQKLSLVVQYKAHNFMPLYEAVTEFTADLENDRRQDMNKNLASRFSKGHFDFCYLLMKFFSNAGKFFSADLLNPFTFQNHFSLGTSWLICFSLCTLFEVSEDYRELKTESVEKAFKNLEFLTEAFAEELVNSGKWQLALYVLRYCKNGTRIMNTLINRNICHEDYSVNESHLEEYSKLVYSAKALYDKHLFEFENAFDGFMYTSWIGQASDIVIQDLAPLCIIKYEGKILYKKLYVKILERLKNASIACGLNLMEEDIYIEYVELAFKLDYKEKLESDQEILELLGKIEKVHCLLGKLPRVTYNQRIAISIMQTSLNKWELKTVALRDKVKGMINPELLHHVDYCKGEDVLRFYENVGFRILKSIVRQ